MNLVLLERDETAGRVALTGRRSRHLREVVRVAVGETLRAGVVRGPRGTATVVEIGGDRVVLEVRLDGAPEPAPDVDVILALPRPKVVTRVVEILASFGVRRVDLVNAWRVDKSYFGSHRVAEAALGEAARRGCEQGGTTWVPEVAVQRLLVPFLEALAPPADAHRLLAHPRAEPLERRLPAGNTRPVVLAIGPEGGWVESELGSFARLGFAQVSVAARVLRVEAACAALLAQISLLRRLGPSVSSFP